VSLLGVFLETGEVIEFLVAPRDATLEQFSIRLLTINVRVRKTLYYHFDVRRFVLG
jgi:hypothetical protein